MQQTEKKEMVPATVLSTDKQQTLSFLVECLGECNETNATPHPLQMEFITYRIWQFEYNCLGYENALARFPQIMEIVASEMSRHVGVGLPVEAYKNHISFLNELFQLFLSLHQSPCNWNDLTIPAKSSTRNRKKLAA